MAMGGYRRRRGSRRFPSIRKGIYPAPRFSMRRRVRASRPWTARVKNVIQRMAEKKIVYSAGSGTMYDNFCGTSVQFASPISNLLQTTQGSGQNNRVGDQIQSIGFEVSLLFNNLPAYNNTLYRILIIAGEEGDLSTAFDWRYDVSGDLMIARVNNDKVRVIYDKNINIPAAVDGTEGSGFVHKFYVPTNKKITYKTNNGTVPNGANYYNLYICTHSSQVAAGMTLGQWSSAFTHKFTDV